MKAVLILTACALACGCTRHQIGGPAEAKITVCGMVQHQDGVPVAEALLQLHKLAKDTPDDAVANSYEVTKTDGSGHFVLRSTYAGRQYWLSIAKTQGCADLNMSELESKRLPVTFQRFALERDCESKIRLSLDSHCGLKLQ